MRKDFLNNKIYRPGKQFQQGIRFSAILNTVVYLPVSGYWTYRLTAHKCD